MIVFDFIYFCIYSFIPDKAIFGKRDVACTLYALLTATFLLFFSTCCSLIFEFKINLKVLGIILFVGLLILTNVIYLKQAKLRSMHRRFGKIPKWLLKTIGIMYLISCFFGSMLISILTYRYLGI
jgi:hypothetical protein